MGLDWDKYDKDTTSAIGLPQTKATPPIPQVETTKDSICCNCIKNDVCNIQDNLTEAMSDINYIKDRVNVFIDINIKCKKFAKKEKYTGIR